MIAAPLPSGIKYTEGLARSEEFLVNMFKFGNDLISRPGVEQFATGVGPCRGRFVFEDKLYQVSGERLLQISEDGTTVDLGEVAGEADIDFAIGFTQVAIVVKGGNGYILQVDETLTQITDTDYVPCEEVTRINGRFVFAPSDGSPVMYSDIGDAGSIGALAFFDAEVLTDKNTGVKGFKNDLYVLGEESIQLFRNIGPDIAPFTPVTGATTEQGYLAAKIDYMDSFCFLGKEKDQQAGFFVMDQGSAKRMSTPAVDRTIQQYSFDELKTCRSQRIVWRGHDLLIFTLPRHSFCFYAGNWVYFQSELHAEELAPWSVRHAIFWKGKYYVGSFDEKIGIISDINSDFGGPIRRVVKTFMRVQNDDAFSPSSISLAVSQGQSLNPGSVGLRLSDDGVLWSSRFFRTLDESGDHTFRVHWEFAGGLGYYRNGFMGIEFYTSSEVIFSVDGLSIYL